MSLDPQAKRDLKKLLKTVSLSSKKFNPETFQTSFRMLGRPEGSIVFNEQEAKALTKLEKKLGSVHGKSRSYGKKYAEKLIKDGIFDVLAGKDVNKTADNIESQLTLPRSKWIVFFPISGFTLHRTRKLTFGGGKFTRLSRDRLTTMFPEGIFGVGDTARLEGLVFLEIPVMAIDRDTALAAARQQAQEIVDVVNCYANIVGGASKFGSIFSSYDTYGNVEHSTILTYSTKNKSRGVKFDLSLPIAGINNITFKRPLVRGWQITKAKSLLSSSSRTDVEERVLSAMQWIGRATLARTAEEAYLAYWYAIEALLGSREIREGVVGLIRERLGRTLFLLRWSNREVDAYKQYPKLYDKRSGIVHRGTSVIEDEDITNVRYLAIGCLHRFLREPALRKLKTDVGLEEWFSA